MASENTGGAAERWREESSETHVLMRHFSRKVEGERRAATQFRRQVNGAVRLLHGSLRDRQSQPRAFALGLGRHIRVEKLLHHLGRNPAAVVRNRNRNQRSGVVESISIDETFDGTIGKLGEIQWLIDLAGGNLDGMGVRRALQSVDRQIKQALNEIPEF
jgi:hypothetical protein